MTTNTTNSQAASIDTPEFRQLLKDYSFYGIERGTPPLIAHIDAKLAQAREEGIQFERKRLVQTIGNANDLSSECLKQRDEANARATAAESRLAEIRRGVEGLQRYGFDGTFGGCFGKNSLGCYVKANAVLALLQPQGQADTSGLPG